ncbi:hypothetical protein KP509_13G088900 [Ceratopteris richardii]|uniref:Uncharacterized protein n=1 Tax=Ceratopteris richardii TaxID=49495 RepID=A0A8T2TFL1_CERRI|nr:hypothetical protein KP509_13G088900 [Ceratopteris richardii]
MGGVWHFGSDGVAKFVRDNVHVHGAQRIQQKQERAVLIYRPTDQPIRSYHDLIPKLVAHGWQRVPPNIEQTGGIQFYRCTTTSRHLITLPADFCSFGFLHMVDIFMKNHQYFALQNEL